MANKQLLLLTIPILILTGCASTPPYNTAHVTDYISFDRPVTTSESFYTLVNSNDEESTPILQNEFLAYIADDLQMKGFKKASTLEESDFFVTISWKNIQGTTQGYSYNLTLPTYSTTNYTTATGAQVLSSGTWGTKTTTHNVAPSTYYTQKYVMIFWDTKSYINDMQTERYRSESTFNSGVNAPIQWAPEHLQKMLETFKKSDPLNTGYLGIGLDSYNKEPKIYHKDLSSLSVQGLYLDDKTIFSVNEIPITYRTQVQKAIKHARPGSPVIIRTQDSDGRKYVDTLISSTLPMGYQITTPFF